MALLVFIYVSRIDVNIERLKDLCLAQTNITCTLKIYFQVTTSPSNKVLSSPNNKV